MRQSSQAKSASVPEANQLRTVVLRPGLTSARRLFPGVVSPDGGCKARNAASWERQAGVRIQNEGMVRRGIKWPCARPPIWHISGGAAVAAVAATFLWRRQTTVGAESAPIKGAHGIRAIYPIHGACRRAVLVMLKDSVCIRPVGIDLAPHVFGRLRHHTPLGVVETGSTPFKREHKCAHRFLHVYRSSS